MTDRVTRLHPRAVKTPAVDDIARRVWLQQTVSAMLPHEPKWAQSDETRLALLVERIGDVAAAFNRGHTDIDGEVLKVWATAQAWAEARGRESAA